MSLGLTVVLGNFLLSVLETLTKSRDTDAKLFPLARYPAVTLE